MTQRNKELSDIGQTNEAATIETILEDHGLTNLCQKTVLNWMTTMGFKYSPKQKSYYVDGHERPEVVSHRKQYVSDYVHNKIRTFRWIQLPENEVNKLEEMWSDFSKNDGETHVKSSTITKGSGMFMRSIVSFMKNSMQAQEDENMNNLKKLIEENTTNYFPVPVLETVEEDQE